MHLRHRKVIKYFKQSQQKYFHNLRLIQFKPGETPEEADIRIRSEKEALKASEEIDKMLRQEVQSLRKVKCVKILLLGQSESGRFVIFMYLCYIHHRVAFRQKYSFEEYGVPSGLAMKE